jgi:phosphohistidine phosphatase
MEIYFLRHGEAAKKGEWDGGDDERPLSKEGTARMTREASAIAGLRLGLELIITSPLVRARQTANILARALRLGENAAEHRGRESLVVDDLLAPGFRRAGLAQVMKKHAGRKALMLVGHEPDFSETIADCIGGGKVDVRKGGLARVDMEDPASLRGVLLWLIPPQFLAP